MSVLIILPALFLLLGALYVYLRKVWFYRDPLREPKPTGTEVYSPADGKVIYIKPVESGSIRAVKLGQPVDVDEISKMPLEKKNGWLIGIYMSPLDVHYNYAPMDATVSQMVYTPAKANLPMVDIWEYIKMAYLRKAVDLFAKKYRLVNERNTLLFDGRIQTVVVEIADKFVSKITPFVKKGDKVRAGQKIGFIDRGSQVDLIIFEPQAAVSVKVGQQVYGAKSVIAKIENIEKSENG